MFTQEVISCFNELDYSIYNTVLRCGTGLGSMQIKELADAAHVSTASVVRFCKKLGCNGYSEFKYRYREELQYIEPTQVQDEIRELDTFLKYAKTPVFREKIGMAFRYLQAATHVLFVGVGTSGDLASFGARIFCNVGCFSCSITDPFLPIPPLKGANDVVVALSFSGTTTETLHITQRFIENGSVVISITHTDKNPLAKISDVNIPYFVKDIPILRMGNLGTQIPALYSIELLAKMLYAGKTAES